MQWFISLLTFFIGLELGLLFSLGYNSISQIKITNPTIPSKIISGSVKDGIQNQWTIVSFVADKVRDDCMPISTRFIRDADGIMSQITESTRLENASEPAASLITIKYMIRIPATVVPGKAEFQVRTRFTCPDGGIFIVASDWLPFNVTTNNTISPSQIN